MPLADSDAAILCRCGSEYLTVRRPKLRSHDVRMGNDTARVI